MFADSPWRGNQKPQQKQSLNPTNLSLKLKRQYIGQKELQRDNNQHNNQYWNPMFPRTSTMPVRNGVRVMFAHRFIVIPERDKTARVAS